MFFFFWGGGGGARYFYICITERTRLNCKFRFNGSYIYFFFFKKKGNTELKSLCITHRLMLIDICFMKISLTVIEI